MFDVEPVSVVTAEEQSGWLLREAVWGTVKSPVEVQHQRWADFAGLDDPAGMPGLVVGANLARFKLDHEHSADLELSEQDRRALTERSAVHLGKLAGGLTSMLTGMIYPDQTEGLVEAHVDVLNRNFDLGDRTSVAPAVYYWLLRSLHQSLRDEGQAHSEVDTVNWTILAAARAANAVAINTWREYLRIHQINELVPGGTPRSSDGVERQQAEFKRLMGAFMGVSE